MTAADQVKDHGLRLPDGRRLGLHGTPESRLKVSIAHEVGRQTALAIVAPDRWGFERTRR
jgi:hypothetical protein